jgi:uncharacterized membrane protein YbhN (UPF0104 family)
MIKTTWKTALKWVWIIFVVGFVAAYAFSRQELILESFQLLNWPILVAALLVTAAAKLTLVENMRLATGRSGLLYSYRDCYCMYNMSQLAKYVPGSIWQFVSRITMLRGRGAAAASIRDAMMAEHAWVLVTALLFGLISVLASVPAVRGVGIVLPPFMGATSLWLVLASVVIVGLAVFFHSVGRRLLRWGWSLRPSLRAVLILLATWLLLGTGLWITVIPFATVPAPWLYSVGIYSLAYIIGFIVPFAPAGLGVREAALVAALSAFVGMDVAVLLAAINRVLYFLVELLVVVPCFWLKKQRTV